MSGVPDGLFCATHAQELEAARDRGVAEQKPVKGYCHA